MNFKIKRILLLNALLKTSRAISLRSPLPFLTGIKFELTNNNLILYGSDSDLSIKTIIEDDNLEIIEPGSIVLSSKYILEIIRKIESDIVHIQVLDGNLTSISGGLSKFELNGISSLEYPSIRFEDNGNCLKLKSSLLKEIIEQTIFATSDKETKPILTGVNFKAQRNKLQIIATDSYRLSKRIVNIDDDVDFNIIIPKRSLMELSKIIENDEIINIFINNRSIVFIFDHIYIKSRLIDGVYPNIDRLIPLEFDYTLNINSHELLSALDRASLLTSENTNVVKLSMNSDNVILYGKSQEIGSVKENLNNSFFKGEPLELAFSSNYVKDALRSIGSDKVIIKFSGVTKPFIICDIDKDDLIQLVLPVRTFS